MEQSKLKIEFQNGDHGPYFLFSKGEKEVKVHFITIRDAVQVNMISELCYRVANSVSVEGFAAINKNIRKIAVEEYCVLCASNYTDDPAWLEVQIEKLGNYAFEAHETKQIEKFLREFVRVKGEICTKSMS